MPATRTRKPRKPKTTQAVAVRGPLVDGMTADWLTIHGWVATLDAGRPEFDFSGFDLALAENAAGEAVDRAERAARATEWDRQEEALRARWRVPEPMQGGCGEGASDVTPLPTSPWLPGGQRFDIPVTGGGADGWGKLSQDAEGHMAAFEQAHDEEGEGWGRLAPPPDISEHEPGEEYEPPHVSGDGDDPRPELDKVSWPAPATRVDIIPSGPHRAHMEQS